MMKNACRAIMTVALLGATVWMIGPAVAMAGNLYDYWHPEDISEKVWYIDESTQAFSLKYNASDINRGTIPNERLDDSSVTLQGNDFNAADKLMQFEGDGKYPAADGSQITDVQAGAMADGTEAAPGLEFTSDPDTGLYKAGANELGIVTGGVVSTTHSATGTDSKGYTEDGSSTLTNSIDGNAGTSSALAADPTDCAAGNFANAIAADGDLTCSADGSSLTGIDADTAAALAADPTDCGDGFYSIGIQADGTAVCSAVEDTAGGVDGSTAAATANVVFDHNANAGAHSAGVAGNAATSSALAADPADCGAGAFANAIAADGDLTCGTDGSSLTGVVAGSVAAANVSAGTLSGAFTFDTATIINGLEIKGADTNSNICAAGCTAGKGACWISSTTDADVYRSTSTVGWMGLFHGLSPCR